jgi:hypothetical protein
MLGISPLLGEISKGLVERVGSLPVAFHAFHRPAISTALFSAVFSNLVYAPCVGFGGSGSFFFLLFFNR